MESKKGIQWTSLQSRNRLTDFGKLMVSKGYKLGSRWGGLGVWDGNAVKSGCYVCWTTINVIKFNIALGTMSRQLMMENNVRKKIYM